MRRTLVIGSLLAVTALWAYTVVTPNVPKCQCHYEWQNGGIVIVCCQGR
jgi:hypothetical protein